MYIEESFDTIFNMGYWRGRTMLNLFVYSHIRSNNYFCRQIINWNKIFSQDLAEQTKKSEDLEKVNNLNVRKSAVENRVKYLCKF